MTLYSWSKCRKNTCWDHRHVSISGSEEATQLLNQLLSMLAVKWKRGKIDYSWCQQGSGKCVLIGMAAEVLTSNSSSGSVSVCSDFWVFQDSGYRSPSSFPNHRWGGSPQMRGHQSPLLVLAHRELPPHNQSTVLRDGCAWSKLSCEVDHTVLSKPHSVVDPVPLMQSILQVHQLNSSYYIA